MLKSLDFFINCRKQTVMRLFYSPKFFFFCFLLCSCWMRFLIISHSNCQTALQSSLGASGGPSLTVEHQARYRCRSSSSTFTTPMSRPRLVSTSKLALATWGPCSASTRKIAVGVTLVTGNLLTFKGSKQLWHMSWTWSLRAIRILICKPYYKTWCACS